MIKLSRVSFITALTTSLLVGAAVVRANAAPARRSVEIEWEAVENASAYEIKVTRTDRSGPPLTFRLQSPRWSANVRPGPYVMQLRSFDRRGVPGAWSPPAEIVVKLPAPAVRTPTPRQIIAAREDAESTVRFAWDPVPLAREYRFEVRTPDQSFAKVTRVNSTSTTMSLAVAANYEWRVTAVDERGEDGEGLDFSAFEILGPSLGTPRLEAPLSRFVDRITWAEVKRAVDYQTTLSVFNRRTRRWDPVAGPERVTTGVYPLDISRPGGRYRLAVTATAPGRPSARAELTFDVNGGFKNLDQLRGAQLRDSLYKQSSYYVIAGLLPGQVSYAAQVRDTNSRVAFDAAAVSARVGLGVQSRASRWSGLATADVTRLGVGNTNFTATAIETHLNYARNLGGRGVVSVGGGLFYKQLPLVLGGPTDGVSSVDRVAQGGPHLGISYAVPFSERWGLRADARIFVAAFGSAGAGQVKPSLSHQAQLLGTYRYTPRLTVLGGVGQRTDAATWSATPGTTSFARPGELNHLSIKSIYLNLGLEFSF